MELEEELKVVGNSLKSLEVSEEKVISNKKKNQKNTFILNRFVFRPING